MPTTTISCSHCPWSDERPDTTRPPRTCPQCGAGDLVIDGKAPSAPKSETKPAPRRRR